MSIEIVDVPLYILDERGEPAVESDLRTWARWYQQDERRVVRQQAWTGANGDEVRLSTVFLGLDHRFSSRPWILRGDEPVLWESMVFGGPLDGKQLRYCSRADAIAGHAYLLGLAHGPPPLDAATELST